MMIGRILRGPVARSRRAAQVPASATAAGHLRVHRRSPAHLDSAVADNSALVIAPRGEIVEQLSGDAVDQALARAQGVRQAETLLWDLVDALEAAKKDARIKAVVLDLDDMAAGGQPTLAELAAAIKDFRSSGKKVIAHSTYYGQEQYYVAAVADEIYLDPLGFVAIDGFERYRTYYKELFDKLGVEVNLFRVGAYKSAAEVYVRNDMSPEDREESLAYLNALVVELPRRRWPVRAA